MFSDFLNNFILDPWRLDLAPHLTALWHSTLFRCIAGVVFVGFLIYRNVRKK